MFLDDSINGLFIMPTATFLTTLVTPKGPGVTVIKDNIYSLYFSIFWFNFNWSNNVWFHPIWRFIAKSIFCFLACGSGRRRDNFLLCGAASGRAADEGPVGGWCTAVSAVEWLLLMSCTAALQLSLVVGQLRREVESISVASRWVAAIGSRRFGALALWQTERSRWG